MCAAQVGSWEEDGRGQKRWTIARERSGYYATCGEQSKELQVRAAAAPCAVHVRLARQIPVRCRWTGEQMWLKT